ncbi:hypothetical protein D3C72_1200280 [compost metagenome]
MESNNEISEVPRFFCFTGGETRRIKVRLGAGRQLVRVRGALGFAVVVILADASRR